MALEVPECLLQLLEDYTSQALDAARDVSDEFEGEMTDLLTRTNRIHAVLKVIRDCESECQRETRLKTLKFTLSNSCQAPAQIALRGMGQMLTELTGVPVVVSMATHLNTSSYGLLPLGRSASLAEAALELFSQNTKVVFRRAEKRLRDNGLSEDNSQQITQPTSVFLRLAAQQRRQRLPLYTARTALFPQAIPSSSFSMTNEQVPSPPFVSPAVREFAELNMEAECEMLTAFYCVDTRAQLLREFPTLQNSIDQLRENLRAAGVVLETVECVKEDNEHMPWFEFPFTGQGVIQVIVRRSLVINITWDSVRGDRWRVLSLHWIMRAQTLPELLPICHLAKSIKDNETSMSLSHGGSLRVQPAHYEATMRYLSNCFETGLESGCLGALRVVNSVVMEVIETQCKTLRETFFVGPLESSFVLDVRPGTHVALMFLPPIMTGSAQNNALHLKYKLCMGTVVVEIRRGTDTQTTRQFDLYANSLGGSVVPPVVVVDVERVFWQLYSD